MPWSVEDVEAKNQGLTPKQKKAWVAVANSVLEQTGDEGAAIERANGVVRKQTSLKESELDSRLGDRHGVTLSEADEDGAHFYGAWRGGSKASGGGPGRAPTKEGRVKDMAARVGAENVGRDPNQRNKDFAASERAKGVKYATHDANGRRLATPDDYAKDPAAAERIRREAAEKVEAARLRDKAENPFDGESAKQFEARTTLKVQPRPKNASQEYLTRRGPESLSVRPQDLHPDFRQASPAEMTARYGPGWENRSRSQQAAYDAKRSKPASPSPTATGSHSDYKAALADAQRRADQSGLPVVIRKGSEFGRPVFNVNYKSNDGSDFRAETVMPNKPRLREAEAALDSRLGDRMGAVREAASEDHFYGAWKGGAKASGGRPMTKAEEAKPNKGEPERPRLEGVRRDSHTQTDDSMLAHIRMNYGIDSPEYQKARADVMAKNAKPPATKSALEGPEWRTDDARLAHMRMKYGADSKEYQAARAEVMAKNQQGNRTANLSGVPGVRVDRQGNIAGRPRLPAQYGATVAQPGAEQARSDLYSSRLSKAPLSRIIGSVIPPRLATKPTAHQLQLEAEARQRRLARRSAIKEAFEAEVDSRLGDRSGLALREVATTPDPKALREADDSDSHFYGAWKGGSKASGGRPMTKSEAAKPNKGEAKPEDNAAANRAKGYPEYWSKADREHHEKVVMPRQERLQAIRDKAERDWAGKTSEERDKAAGELANRAANLQRRYGDKMPDSVSERVLALRSEKEGIDRATRKAEQAEREGRFARGEETAGRVSIKAKQYRGEDGFIVQSVGGGRTSNALRNFGARTESVFVKAKTRKGAEYIRDLIKQGKEVDSAAFARAAEM